MSQGCQQRQKVVEGRSDCLSTTGNRQRPGLKPNKQDKTEYLQIFGKVALIIKSLCNVLSRSTLIPVTLYSAQEKHFYFLYILVAASFKLAKYPS